jgi:CheY-like chemotaxis protein
LHRQIDCGIPSSTHRPPVAAARNGNQAFVRIEGSKDEGALPQEGSRTLKTILVVDDDPDVLDYAISVLEEFGYRVLAASDGAGALSLLRSDGRVDLLFTDVVMPGLNGFEVAARAVAAAPNIKVLFASGYATDLTQAAHILHKPYRPQQLTQEITALLPLE